MTTRRWLPSQVIGRGIENQGLTRKDNMFVRINFTRPDGTEDSIVFQGDTNEAIKLQSDKELAKRGAVNPWSEVLEE